MEKKNYFSSVIHGAIRGVSQYFVSSYIVPIIIPLLTLLITKLEGWPWSYTWLAILASLALGFTWLKNMRDWLNVTRVKDKIAFSSLRFGAQYNTDNICLGANLDSAADFPIKFKIEKLNLRILDKTPVNDFDVTKSYIIPPKGTGWFYSHFVNLEKNQRNGTIEGVLDFSVLYGKSSFDYVLSGKKQFFLTYDDQGLLIDLTWNDMV